MIDKEKFKKYVGVQKSGITNMWAVDTVCQLTGLTKEECLDIMKNYQTYKEKFGKD